MSGFLLSNDDAIVIRAKKRMARQSALDSTLWDVDWAKCEIRHIKYRKTMNLGIARPLTVLRKILANHLRALFGSCCGVESVLAI